MASKRIKEDDERDIDEEPLRKKASTSIISFKWEPEDVLSDFCSSVSVSRNVCGLFDEGCSIPFIARYRRDQTNAMPADDLRHFLEKYDSLKKVRSKVCKLAEQVQQENKLTSALKKTLECITSNEEFELVSAPFKPSSKQTLASRARSIPGLLELAEEIIDSQRFKPNLNKYTDPKIKGRENYQEVKTSLGYIITDIMIHDGDVMLKVRDLIKNTNNTRITSSKRSGKNESNLKDKYQNYHDFSMNRFKIKPHQILALNRGESEKFLSIKVSFPDHFKASFVSFCKNKFKIVSSNDIRYDLLLSCIEDGFKRLVLPSAQRRVRSELTQSAIKESINVFAMNLRKLLLTPPLPNKIILGVDPGFKNGCKMAVIGVDGSLLGTGIFYLDKKQSYESLSNLVKKHKVEYVALGNGTGCRKAEEVITDIIRRNSLNLMYTIVNEQGASIYSCSEMAKSEFPHLDPNLISAVSIASRLRDPLAEYLKIEPKHLGVGMYQHDVSETKLKNTLEEIVSECVSFVGVDLNTAPSYLLEKVSGLNKTNAKDIIAWRNEHKGFESRSDLKNVKGIGKKKFELCAGFVRLYPISQGVNDLSNPLDATLIHPESYDAAMEIIKSNGFRPRDVGTSKLIHHFRSISTAPSHQNEGDSHKLIMQGLSQELRSDIRESESKPLFRKEALSATDLKVNKTILHGKVTNVTHFGAFLDCGVGINGLLHTSRMNGQSIELGMRLRVMVISLDISAKKLGLGFVGFE